MGTINKKRKDSLVEKKHEEYKERNSHLNWMGGPSYKIGDPIYNLRLAASSCFFGEPQYYHTSSNPSLSVGMGALSYLRETLNAVDPQGWRGMSPRQMMESAIDRALDHNPEETLKEAVRLRNEDFIRTTPQVILVRAANHPNVKGTGLIRKYANEIVKRADEPAVCLAYQLEAFGKPIPNALKKALGDKLSSFSEYQLAKYKMEAREVKTVDVVNLVHPKATPALTKLVKGELKQTETWESMRSAGKSWEECIPHMGHMALLRNLRNFHSHGVSHSLYIDKLTETAVDGKQLPFRYYTAYRELEKCGASPVILDALEECLVISLGNMPKFGGRTMSLCDNSGSARGAFTSELGSAKVSDIANLTGVLTGMVSEEGYVGVFGDRLVVQGIRKNASVFDQVNSADSVGDEIGHSTEHGIWLFWDAAIKERQHWDNVFIYSDMQAGHGGLYGTDFSLYNDYRWMSGRFIDVPKLIAEYRRTVNKNVNVFCVQVAGYQDTIIPEFYDRTYILGGWSSGVLKFAESMIKLQQ